MGAAEEDRQERAERRANDSDVITRFTSQIKGHQATFHAVLATAVSGACASRRDSESRVRANVQREDVLSEQCREQHGGDGAIYGQPGKSHGANSQQQHCTPGQYNSKNSVSTYWFSHTNHYYLNFLKY